MILAGRGATGIKGPSGSAVKGSKAPKRNSVKKRKRPRAEDLPETRRVRKRKTTKKKKNILTYTLRVAYINIRHLKPKINEINLWLNNEIANDRAVQAMLFTEPMLADDELVALNPNYSMTDQHQPNHLQNPHLNPRAIYMHTDDQVTIIDATKSCEPLHPGIHWLKVLPTEERKFPIMIGVAYIPNTSAKNPWEYNEAIYKALEEQITCLKEAGCAIVLAMDSNSPHYAPHKPKNAVRNQKAFREFSKKMINLNWTKKTKGFYTRKQSGVESQLDFVFVNQCALDHIDSMVINDLKSFGSDHMLFQLQMNLVAMPKRKLTKRTPATYVCAGEEHKKRYQHLLNCNLKHRFTQSCEEIKKLMANPKMGGKDKAKQVSVLTKKINLLTKLVEGKIVESFDTAAQHKPPAVQTTYRHVIRQPEETGLFKLTHDREIKRAQLQEAQALNPSDEEKVNTLKAEHAKTEKLVRQHINYLQQRKINEGVGTLKAAFNANDPNFFEVLDRMEQKVFNQLPPTLVQNGREVRRPNKIKDEWVSRYDLDQKEMGNELDQEMRKEIEKKVEHFSKDTTFDDGPEADLSLLGPFSKKEYKVMKCKLKPHSSPADDGVSNEMISKGEDVLQDILLLFFDILFESEVIPHHWKLAILVPLFKKGCRKDKNNYRPIGKLAVLFKIYERLLDARIRLVIHLPPEQCGFRENFSTHTLLMRVHIFMEYCANREINFSLVAADFKEAFERAWRPGILYRLWKMGIRGKMWRILKNMLTDTKASVRTNFGDTRFFRITQGVTQGSVLAALLFIIIATPLSKALSKWAPEIDGIKMLTQFFADDCTLLATSPAQREILLTKFLAWTNRWNFVVKTNKTHLFTRQRESEYFALEDLILKEVEKFRLLGVEIEKKGLVTAQQLHVIEGMTAKRVATLAKVASSTIPVQTKMMLFLYRAILQTVGAYAAPHVRKKRGLHGMRDKSQMKIIRRIMGISDEVSDFAIRSELSLLDSETQTSVLRLLLVHRLVNNEQDTLTVAMLNFPLIPGKADSTEMQEAQKQLATLGSYMDMEAFLDTPYQAAKNHLTCMATEFMQSKHSALAQTGTYNEKRYLKLKPQWGADEIILESSTCDVAAYIEMRSGIGSGMLSTFNCALCHHHLPESHHLLFECKAMEKERTIMLAKVKLESPRAHNHLFGALAGKWKLANDFLFGQAKDVCTMSGWNALTENLMIFSSRAKTLLKEKSMVS